MPRWMIGVGIALIGGFLLLCMVGMVFVGAGSGQVYPVSETPDGSVVYMREQGPDFFPGAFLFLVVLGMGGVLAYRALSARGEARPWGPWTAKTWTIPNRKAMFDEWHRQAHAGEVSPHAPESPSSAPPAYDPAGPGANPTVRL